MNDTDTIQTAYGATLTQLFAVYFDSLTSAGGNATAAASALDDFKRGLALARHARDAAIDAVQSGARPPNVEIRHV